jgi:ATP-dependent Lon protease
MPNTITQTLPLLPLKDGVILPHMVVTISVEEGRSDEAYEAISAARKAEGLVLLVPRVDGRYAGIGTVGKLEDSGGRMPDGDEVFIVRGLHRAVVGTGVPGVGNAVWVQAEAKPDPALSSEHAQELAKEYRAIVENILDMRGERGVARFLRGIVNPGHMADTSGYANYLTFEQKLEVLETLDVEERLEKLIAWSKETLAEYSLKDNIRTDVA